MQFNLATLAILAVATLAVATPTRRTGSPPASQCNTGDLQCCNSVQQSDSSSLAPLLKALGINVQDITGLVGVTCSPISAIGVGGNSCTAQPVCCSNNTFNGVVAIGCTPVNINL